MSDMKVIDKEDGEWVINTGDYGLPDYARHAANPGTELIIIQPGIPTKIVMSGYLKEQTTLKPCDDPMGTPAPKKGGK